MHFPGARDVAQSLLQLPNALVDEPTIRFELGFSRPSHSDAASEFLEVRPHSRQTGEHVFQLREFHLHFRLGRPRPRGEDVKDELGAIHYALPRRVFDVFPLRRCELVVEDHERRIRLLDQRAELFDLPFSEIGRGVRAVDLLGDASDYDGAGGVRELLELLEMLVDVMPR